MNSIKSQAFIIMITGFLCIPEHVLSQQKIKIIKDPSASHFFTNDYSDTLYTYLDESGKQMSHSAFWVKKITEKYAIRGIKENGKQTIKQLHPLYYHKLIGSMFNFDSLDYSFIGNKNANDYKGKKVVLISFWPLCGGCIALDKEIKLLEKEYPDVVFVHLALGPWKGLAAYKEKYGMGDIIYLGKNANPDFVKLINYEAPLSFFINEQSKIEVFQTGSFPYDFLRKAYIEKIQKL